MNVSSLIRETLVTSVVLWLLHSPYWASVVYSKPMKEVRGDLRREEWKSFLAFGWPPSSLWTLHHPYSAWTQKVFYSTVQTEKFPILVLLEQVSLYISDLALLARICCPEYQINLGKRVCWIREQNSLYLLRTLRMSRLSKRVWSAHGQSFLSADTATASISFFLLVKMYLSNSPKRAPSGPSAPKITIPCQKTEYNNKDAEKQLYRWVLSLFHDDRQVVPCLTPHSDDLSLPSLLGK